MIILTFDTTMSTCSALIQNNGIIVSKFNQTVIHGQSELILSAIEEILRSAKINYFDIDKVGVTLGPGSFTGIRVGIATARALGLTNKIKCMCQTKINVRHQNMTKIHATNTTMQVQIGNRF